MSRYRHLLCREYGLDISIISSFDTLTDMWFRLVEFYALVTSSIFVSAEIS